MKIHMILKNWQKPMLTNIECNNILANCSFVDRQVLS